LSDQRLLAGIAACDADAFRVFYRRHLPRVLRYLLRETRDREVAADLAAEVFSAVLLAAKRYRPERGTAVPWVLAIAHNVLGASRRRRRVEDRGRRRLGIEPIEFDDYDLQRTEERADERGGVVGLVERLPEDERDARQGEGR
jgi:RNA polymerase sigma-70 factor (ECF subfamily)